MNNILLKSIARISLRLREILLFGRANKFKAPRDIIII